MCFLSPRAFFAQNYTISYLIEKGADARKLVLGIPTFGRTFRLTDPKDTLLGAPADGPGTGGEVTRRLGYLAYYEVRINSKKFDHV